MFNLPSLSQNVNRKKKYILTLQCVLVFAIRSPFCSQWEKKECIKMNLSLSLLWSPFEKRKKKTPQPVPTHRLDLNNLFSVIDFEFYFENWVSY